MRLNVVQLFSGELSTIPLAGSLLYTNIFYKMKPNVVQLFSGELSIFPSAGSLLYPSMM